MSHFKWIYTLIQHFHLLGESRLNNGKMSWTHKKLTMCGRKSIECCHRPNLIALVISYVILHKLTWTLSLKLMIVKQWQSIKYLAVLNQTLFFSSLYEKQHPVHVRYNDFIKWGHLPSILRTWRRFKRS